MDAPQIRRSSCQFAIFTPVSMPPDRLGDLIAYLLRHLPQYTFVIEDEDVGGEPEDFIIAPILNAPRRHGDAPDLMRLYDMPSEADLAEVNQIVGDFFSAAQPQLH